MSDPKINLNKEIIALFSGQTKTITTPKLYIELTQSYTQANVLNQCIYWSNKSKLNNGWFYKTYNEWFEEIHINERTLRRIFKKLEKKGFILTKIKKVKGVNTLHIFMNVDFLIDCISNMLSQECPNRTLCPNEPNDDQNSCTKSAPTGQSVRSEPDKVSVSGGSISLDTNNYFQKRLTNCVSSSSSFLFSETTDRNLLNQKLSRDSRTDEEFMVECLKHVENCSDKKFPVLQRANSLVKLLKRLKAGNIIFNEKESLGEKKKNELANETDKQRQERQFFTYELLKEREDSGYVSNALINYPEMRTKYEKYARQG
jgi:hypothetical protein